MTQIESLTEYEVGLVVGIRFRANFSIEDSIGSMVDKILYDKSSYFNPKIFPIVQHTGKGKILANDSNNDKFSIDNSNIVLDLLYDDHGSFDVSNSDEILNKFNEQIIEGIMKDYKITELIRVGIVKRYLFPVEDLADSFINKTIGRTQDGINDINLRFSKKIPTSEGVIKKEVYDYNNVIFNIIKQADKDELFVSVDYQKYFEPFLNSVSELKFLNFKKSVDNFNTKNYLPWLNKNYLNE